MEKQTFQPAKDAITPQDFLHMPVTDESAAAVLQHTRQDMFRRIADMCKDIMSFHRFSLHELANSVSQAAQKTVSPLFRQCHRFQLLKETSPASGRGKQIRMKHFSAVSFKPKVLQCAEREPDKTDAGFQDKGVRLATAPGAETSHVSHVYDDRTPLCASPLEPNAPAYVPLTVENIWCALQLTQPVAQQIKTDMSAFLHMTPQERFEYFETYSEVRKITIYDCDKDQCDKGLIGQRGLFATEDLPIFTVLGVYAGVFLRNQKELDYLAGLHGKKNISDYMFRICQTRLWPKLSAYRHGSRLSIVNSASDYSEGLHAGLQTVVKRMNAAVFYARTKECPFPEIRESAESPDLVFFVTCKEVKKGEQLLTDYGPIYWAND